MKLSPVSPATDRLVASLILETLVKLMRRKLTGDGRDGAQVVRGATLQSDGDRTLSVSPSDLEGLAGFHIGEIAGGVGQSNLGAGKAGKEDGRDDELHFVGGRRISIV